MVAKRGKVIRTELPESRIADIQDIYKYLAIPQANGSNDEDAKKSAKYFQRLRQLLRNQLNVRNRTQASICTVHPTSHQIL